MSLEGLEESPFCHVPQPHGLIFGAGNQARAIWRHSYRKNGSIVSSERGLFAARLQQAVQEASDVFLRLIWYRQDFVVVCKLPSFSDPSRTCDLHERKVLPGRLVK